MQAEATKAAQWDELVESALAMTKALPSKPRRSAVALPLRAKPEHKHRLREDRSIALIEPALRQTIRGLVIGELAWPLVLHGSIGTGKTCAALALLDYAGGEYHTVSSLCDLLIQAQQGRLEWSELGRGGNIWPEGVWKRIAAAPLVVLDELGTRETVSDAQFEAVKRCIDERAWKPFVAISNLPLASLGRLYDARIVSRLASGTTFEIHGKDRRLA